MQQTTNYNLNLPEGTDVVNPLVDYNPNFSTIDEVMKANANRTVGRATCIKSGTTHVVTRSNTDSPIINFTATGDWNTGDTMTIDSKIVSVFLPDGSAPLTGAYVINSEVLAMLNGSRVTLYTGGVSTLDANDVTYDNTSSGLTATDAQTAIDELSVAKADKSDVASINVVGSINTTGNIIAYGTYFYLNHILVRATTNITVNTTFTEFVNYETVSAGGLNDVVNNSKWILISQYSDNEPHNLPTDYSEVLVLTQDSSNFYYSTIICKDMLLPTERPFYLSSTGAFRIADSYIKKVNGATIRVYYKK